MAIGLYRYGRGTLEGDGLLSYTMNLIGLLFVSFICLSMLLMVMAFVGAFLGAMKEAVRFQKLSDPRTQHA